MTSYRNVHGSFYVPGNIVAFIKAYLSDKKLKSICDPWAGIGSFVIPIAKEFKQAKVYAFEPNKDAVEEAKSSNATKNISWSCANPLLAIDSMKEQINVIVSCPPFGVHPSKETISATGVPIEIHDDQGNLVLLKSCLRLTNGGTGIFIVTDNFLFANQTKKVRANLPRFGLCIKACISIPSGAFLPMTSIGANIIIIERGEPCPIFVGELSDDNSRNEVLLRNLKGQQDGKTLALGRFVEPETFRGYGELQASERVQKMAKRFGGDRVKLSEIAEKINLTKAAKPPGFEDHPNAVYLPLIGRSDAVSLLSEIKLKPHNYAQIVLKPEVVESQYLAGFFNSPLGLAIRKQSCTGAYIPKISKSSLFQTEVFLPDKQTQIKTVECSTKIGSLFNELRELEQHLWNSSKQLDKTLKAVELVNKEESFADWLDMIPFPLATILWTYHASREDDKRGYEHLLQFFEALAEFWAIILLSAFSSNQVFFENHRKKLHAILVKNKLSFEISSFGTWKIVVEYLAKQSRILLNGKEEERSLCEQLFKTCNPDVLNMLFRSELIGLLQETNKLRNNWSGHGGIVSERDAHDRHIVLQVHLSKVREYFGALWKSYELIQPESCQIKPDIYENKACSLMGNRTPFRRIKRDTTHQLITEKLYLFAQDETRALQLLPLIKVMASPKTEQNACYFFNKQQKDGLRFVSYHFEKEAEITEQFADTANALNIITISENETL